MDGDGDIEAGATPSGTGAYRRGHPASYDDKVAGLPVAGLIQPGGEEGPGERGAALLEPEDDPELVPFSGLSVEQEQHYEQLRTSLWHHLKYNSYLLSIWYVDPSDPFTRAQRVFFYSWYIVAGLLLAIMSDAKVDGRGITHTSRVGLQVLLSVPMAAITPCFIRWTNDEDYVFRRVWRFAIYAFIIMVSVFCFRSILDHIADGARTYVETANVWFQGLVSSIAVDFVLQVYLYYFWCRCWCCACCPCNFYSMLEEGKDGSIRYVKKYEPKRKEREHTCLYDLWLCHIFFCPKIRSFDGRCAWLCLIC